MKLNFSITEYLDMIKEMGEIGSAMKETADQRWGGCSLQQEPVEGIL